MLGASLGQVQNELMPLSIQISACINLPVIGTQCLFKETIVTVDIPVPIDCPVACTSPPAVSNGITCKVAYNEPVSQQACAVTCNPGFVLDHNTLLCTNSSAFSGSAQCLVRKETAPGATVKLGLEIAVGLLSAVVVGLSIVSLLLWRKVKMSSQVPGNDSANSPSTNESEIPLLE